MKIRQALKDDAGKGTMPNWFMYVAPFVIVLGIVFVPLSIIYNIHMLNVLGGMMVGGASAPFFFDLNDRMKDDGSGES